MTLKIMKQSKILCLRQHIFCAASGISSKVKVVLEKSELLKSFLFQTGRSKYQVMKKTAVTVLKIAVSLGILALILRKVDFNELWKELRTANASYVAASAALYLGVQALSAYRWYVLLKPIGVETPYKRILSFYLLGMYFNFFLPTAIGGDAVRVYYLTKRPKS